MIATSKAPAVGAALALACFVATPLRAQESGALPRATPESEGVSSLRVLEFVQAADTAIDAMNSFMLVRHGRVVAEGWWRPYAPSTPHMLYSLSKSFTSTAVGLAVAAGKLGVDDEVLKFFPGEAPPEPSENLRAMRVRDLLRMNTGQQTEPSWIDVDSSGRETWAHRFLSHPVPFKPGTHFLYDTPATYMLSAIVQHVTGQTVLDYLEPRVFEPLGIARPSWTTSPQGVSAGGYGLSVRTEDIAKLGLLYLRKGTWNGRQLLPATWVAEATRLQTSNGSNPASDWDQGYGYQFWRCRHGAYRGDGAFGQYMIVLPGQDAVVAITSGVRDMQAVLNLVWDKLLPAFAPAPLAQNSAAHADLVHKLASLSVRVPSGTRTSPLAVKITRIWYDLPPNDRGLRAIALDLTSSTPALVVRTAAGESRTPIGIGSWAAAANGFANGIEHFLSAPERPLIAASGAWTSDSVFTLKLVAPETPFYSTMNFRFSGDRLVLDTRYNVSFGPTELPRLEGIALRR